MKPSAIYRLSSVFILILAVGHTLGFQKTNPAWGVDQLVAMMMSIQFDIEGFTRTYWDFFVGYGFVVSVFLFASAVLTWQLSRLSPATLVSLRGIAWTLAVCFCGVAILAWTKFFLLPIIFSTIAAALLIAAAWTLPR